MYAVRPVGQMDMTVALDVQKKINKRRSGAVVVDPKNHTERHEKAHRFLDAVEDVATWMSGAIITMLSEYIDDLNTAGGELRLGIQRCCRRMLTSAAQREERVLFFHEAIPGFTVLAVKKEGWDAGLATSPSSARKSSSKSSNNTINGVGSTVDAERTQAVQDMIGAYVQRTGNRVMAIDGEDITLILFPVSDLKKNLQEMGFWGG